MKRNVGRIVDPVDPGDIAEEEEDDDDDIGGRLVCVVCSCE